MTTYKATSDQWAYQKHWAKEDGDAACLLELRSRVEQLEANTKQWRTDHLRLANTCASLAPDRLSFFDALLPDDEDSQPTPNSLPIRSSLVERVHSCIVGEPECGHVQARAAICEVLAWLKEGEHTWAALKLEQEVER